MSELTASDTLPQPGKPEPAKRMRLRTKVGAVLAAAGVVTSAVLGLEHVGKDSSTGVVAVETAQTQESLESIVKHLQNPKVGDIIPTYDMGADNMLVLGGDILIEDAKEIDLTEKAKKANYLDGTRTLSPAVGIVNGEAWACASVSTPEDVRCVSLTNNHDLSVYNSATDTTTKFVASDNLPIKYMTVAKVGEDGFGYAATATGFEGIAYNPPQA